MNQQLGNLEETVLLLVAVRKKDCYAYAIAREYKKQMKTGISISAIHAVLQRLENKGYLKSSLTDPTPKRGGRRKRVFILTSAGFEILRNLQENRIKLWNLIPEFKLSI